MNLAHTFWFVKRSWIFVRQVTGKFANCGDTPALKGNTNVPHARIEPRIDPDAAAPRRRRRF